MRFVYHDGADQMELSDGLGIISRDVPFEVPDELAHGFEGRPQFIKVEDTPKVAERLAPKKKETSIE